MNQAEWENPENWSAGSNVLCVYFSRKDTRVWVPKRRPWMGWTLNVGRSGGVAWGIGFLVGIPLLIIIMNIVVMESCRRCICP
jgi:uncharacterized membrane protein